MSASGVEWTAVQQLSLFLESAGLGLLFGVAFDILGGVQSLLPRRRFLRWTLDILFGVTAAFVTFFAALAKMDGVMHPLLFGGLLLGMAAEHAAIGKGIQVYTRRSVRAAGRIRDFLARIGSALTAFLTGFSPRKEAATEEKAVLPKKIEKKFDFFEKTLEISSDTQ